MARLAFFVVRWRVAIQSNTATPTLAVWKISLPPILAVAASSRLVINPAADLDLTEKGTTTANSSRSNRKGVDIALRFEFSALSTLTQSSRLVATLE
jgi:hypothetical protein